MSPDVFPPCFGLLFLSLVKAILYIIISNQSLIFCTKLVLFRHKTWTENRENKILQDWGNNIRKITLSVQKSIVKAVWNVTAKLVQEMYDRDFSAVIILWHNL